MEFIHRCAGHVYFTQKHLAMPVSQTDGYRLSICLFRLLIFFPTLNFQNQWHTSAADGGICQEPLS